MPQPDGYIRVAGYERIGGTLPGKVLSVAAFRDDLIVICELPDGSPSEPYISFDGSWRRVLDLETD